MDGCKNYTQYKDELTWNPTTKKWEDCWDGTELYDKLKAIQPSYDKEDFNSEEWYDTVNLKLNKYSYDEEYSSKTFDDFCSQEQFKLNNHQKFVARYLNTHTDTNGILIWHGLGSGKTCTSILVAEEFKSTVLGQKISKNSNTPNKVIVVAPAPLVNQYKEELKGDCTKQLYLWNSRQEGLEKQEYSLKTQITKLKNIIKNLQSKINKTANDVIALDRMKTSLKVIQNNNEENINTNYTILSHEKFVRELYSYEGVNMIEGRTVKALKKYKNSIIVIDEAHKLVSALGSGYNKLLTAVQYAIPKSVRIVLMSGTPIYDKPHEIGLTLNLLRPRILFPSRSEDFISEFCVSEKDLSLRPEKKDLFKFMCAGYISYFKGGNPNAYPQKKIIIYNHDMSGEQADNYIRTVNREIEEEQKKEQKGTRIQDILIKILTKTGKNIEESISVFHKSRLACQIFLPNTDSAGNLMPGLPLQEKVKLLLKILSETYLSYRTYNYATQVLTVCNQLSRYSSKFAKTIELSLQNEEPVFIYSNYLDFGVETIAKILKVIGGWEWKLGGTKPQGTKFTYFLWKSGTKNTQQAQELFNSPENFNGSQIKIILGSPSTKEGVNFKRVRQVHILDPWWNDSRMEQIIARAVRFCSHSGLPPDQHNVSVFIHLSTLGGIEKDIISYKGLNEFSLDEYMYKKAQNKLKYARSFYQPMKEAAIDCKINQNGNLTRLNYFFTTDSSKKINENGDKLWKLTYLDYTSGQQYKRQDSKEYFTEFEIMNNSEPIEQKGTIYTNVSSGVNETIPQNLILKENITCGIPSNSIISTMSPNLLNLHKNYKNKDILLNDSISTFKLLNCLQNILNGDLKTDNLKQMNNTKLKIKKLFKEASEKEEILNKIIITYREVYGEEIDDTLLKEDSLDNLKNLLDKIKKDKRTKEEENLPGSFDKDA